jgi:histone-lysine N-methyltransferase MLL3
MFRLDEDRVIDATLAGGLARYINHSCNPNCVAEAVEIDRERKILIIANRKILKGEEVGFCADKIWRVCDVYPQTPLY